MGIVAAHKNSDFINKPLSEILPLDFERENLGELIQGGKEHSFYKTDEDGSVHFISLAPIKAGNSYSSWSLALSIPMSVITERADETLYFSLVVGIGGLLFLMIVLVLVANSLTKPIVKITKSLNKLSHGEISSDLILKLRTGDEIETMANALNISIEGLNKKTSFANDIGKGHLESDLHMLSENDVLGKSLIDMRNSLKKAKEEEVKRTIEDEKRTWANEGFAKFADILRQNNDDLQKLTDEVLKNLVKYVDGNQGALFLANDEEKGNRFLETSSVYASNRKKFIDIKIQFGEGLVGACALERETIFLTDIPENFVTISSGLGESNPSCIIMVPLKQDEKVMGVLEIASLKVLEPHIIEFLEKVAESVATTISSVKINAKTRYLLEQSQQQAEEMQAQEEEMRQNMEELLATQEEMARKEKEIAWTMDALGGMAMIIEYDFKGIITNANALFCSHTGYTKDELVGQHHSMIFDKKDVVNSENYQQFWQDMRNKVPFEGLLTRVNKFNKNFTVKGHCHPVFDDDGQPIKVVEVSVDVTEILGKKK